jgi:hypothetical protein
MHMYAWSFCINNHAYRAQYRVLFLKEEYWNENPIYVFQEKECAASAPISIFVCLRAIYIFPKIGSHIFLQQNKRTYKKIAHRHMKETHTHISKAEFFDVSMSDFDLYLRKK